MLPWPCRLRAPYDDLLIGHPGANAICDDPIDSPIATADDVTGASRCDADGRHALGKKRMEKRLECELRPPFGTTVDVLAAQSIGFSISPRPFYVIVGLVAGDDDSDARPIDFAERLKHGCRPHYIDSECIHWVVICGRNDGLCGKVKNEIRLEIQDNLRQSRFVADIS